MAIVLGVGSDDEGGNVNARRLEFLGDMIERRGLGPRGDAVVSDERVRQNEDLALVGRICEGFCVSDHAWGDKRK